MTRPNIPIRLIVTLAVALLLFFAPVQAQPVFKEGVVIDVNSDGSQGVISIGAKAGAKAGAEFLVVRKGEKIIDPATKKLIRVKQEIVGQVEVISATPTYSDVKIVKGAGKVKKGDLVRSRTSAPDGLKAKSVGFRKIRLSWRLQDEPETEGYKIYRALSSKSGYEEIGSTRDRDDVIYIDEEERGNKLRDGTKYYYRVTSINSLKKESGKSDPVSVSTEGPPPPPRKVDADGGKVRAIFLKWEMHPNEEVAGYRIYRSKSSRGPFERIEDISSRKTTEYEDYGGGSSSSPKLDDDTTYYYAISAYSPYGDEGPRSKAAKATTAGPPDLPKGFEALGWQPRKVPVSWKPSRDENVRGYLLYRSEDEKGPYQQIAEIKDRKKTSFVDEGESGLFEKGLKDFTVYYYKIQTYNWAGSRSRMSAAISATTRAAPLPPEAVKATSNRPRQIPLSWRLSPEADIKEYQIYRSARKDTEFKQIATVAKDKSYYLDDRLEDDTSFYYRMKVADAFGLVSDFSETVAGSTKKLPAQVQGIRWTRQDGDIVLKWNKNPEKDLKVYQVYKKGFFGYSKVGETKDTTYLLVGFGSGDKGDFAVSAVDVDNLEGERSGTLTIDLR